MKTAVCLIVRNEVRDIAEWIAFHAAIGFDTQIIFDNASDDGTTAVIKAAATLYDIRYRHWPDASQQSQTAAYDAVCRAYKRKFDWIAFIDADEFLIPAQPVPINRLLTDYERFSAIGINWAMYGSNGHRDYPDGLVTESFTRRAEESFFPCRHMKSIIRPRCAVRCMNPHYFEMRRLSGGGYCDPAGQPIEWWATPETGGTVLGVTGRLPEYGLLRINHYYTRSHAHWLAKLKRGYPSNVAVRTLDEFEIYDRNEVVDDIALRYLPEVRQGLARIMAKLADSAASLPPSDRAATRARCGRVIPPWFRPW